MSDKTFAPSEIPKHRRLISRKFNFLKFLSKSIESLKIFFCRKHITIHKILHNINHTLFALCPSETEKVDGSKNTTRQNLQYLRLYILEKYSYCLMNILL